jgi:hypothetical protein
MALPRNSHGNVRLAFSGIVDIGRSFPANLDRDHPPSPGTRQEGLCGFIRLGAEMALKIFALRLDPSCQVGKPVAYP